MDKQLEMTAELRKARTWIIAVGIIMFVIDMVVLNVLYGDRLPDAVKSRFMMYDVVILGFFVGMWVVAKYKPVVGCVLALCGFWALHLYVASQDPSSLSQGIIMKVLFTLALIRGIKSANRAEQLKRELAQVFD
jgi:hypothetical protein